MNKVTVRDIDLKGKKVLMRCDFNVPLDENLNITDKTRIIAALPTIQYVLDQGAKLILCSHLGRPKGEVKKEFSLAPVAKELSVQLGREVKLADDIIGDSAKALTANMNEGDVVLLENVRYDAREEANDEEFSKELASLAEVYVNDAFGTAHRAHASNVGIASNIKGEAVAGFLMEKEIKFIGDAVDNPVRPFVAILGGAKVSDKISVIENLLNKADKILICGAMAYTFYKAQGWEVGTSKCEDDFVEFAKGLLAKANGKIVLPCDTVVADKFPEDGVEVKTATVASNAIPADMMGLDVGPATIKLFAKELEGAKTVVWNGPAGVFEVEAFAKGTNEICKVLSELKGATTIIGGGDSASAAIKLGYEKKFTHISTGGGASLEYLEGKVLPGVACINDK